MKDSKIIELIAAGKTTTAFELIYKHYPMIKKMIIVSGGNSDDVRDVFQDGVLIFYRMTQKKDFVLTSSVSTLLYSICRKIWYKKLRDHHVKYKNVQWEDDYEAEEITLLDESIENNERLNLAETVLNELGEPCKSILVKFYYEKLSMKEIADTMHYSNEKTAKAQKYKCIERGKKMLKEKIDRIKLHLL